MAVASDGLDTRVEEFQNSLGEINLGEFSDIYFNWSEEASEMADFNPRVLKHVHAGLTEEMDVAGLEETAEIYEGMTGDEVDIYIAKEDVEGREPLMMVEGPLQDVLVPETLVLGSLSYHLTEENLDGGFSHVDPEEYGEGIEDIVEILGELSQEIGQKIGFADFGARHYHPAQQEELARAAQQAYQTHEVFEDDIVGHSTQKGVEAINDMLEDGEETEASGTMNHAFVIPHIAEHGMANATLEAFKNYDDWFRENMDAPTPVLIDTANQEIDDTLEVCEHLEDEYGDDFELTVRIDTNGANFAQGVDSEDPEDKGVSVEAAKAWNNKMIDEGYRENINFLISSGKGYVDEMQEWSEACIDFHEETGYALFDGVGAGSFDTTNNIYATSDIVQVEGQNTGKKGRLEELQNSVEGDFRDHIDENMEKYTA